MCDATTNLDRLADALGDYATYLQHAPFSNVLTASLHDEPGAVSLRILLGHTTDDKEAWIYLYLGSTPQASAEIQFHEYDSDGTHLAKLDGETIGRVVSSTSDAFKSPTKRKLSKSKIVALAKYYFLRSLVDTNATADEQLQFHLPISKTFKEDLVAVCREFKEAENAKRVSDTKKIEAKRLADRLWVAANLVSSSPESAFSDTHARLVAEDESDSSLDETLRAESVLSGTTITDPRVSNEQDSQQDTLQSLLELSRDEVRIESNTEKIEHDMIALETKHDTLIKEGAVVQKRMADMLEGLSATAAFALGRQVERETTDKRRRT